MNFLIHCLFFSCGFWFLFQFWFYSFFFLVDRVYNRVFFNRFFLNWFFFLHWSRFLNDRHIILLRNWFFNRVFLNCWVVRKRLSNRYILFRHFLNRVSLFRCLRYIFYFLWAVFNVISHLIIGISSRH